MVATCSTYNSSNVNKVQYVLVIWNRFICILYYLK